MTKFYAYKHVNGEIKVRRYFDDGDIEEVSQSPFVADYTGCIEADDIEDARKKAEPLLK